MSSQGRLLVISHTSAVMPFESLVRVLQPSMKGTFMKKVKSNLDELRAEYKRSDVGKLERGKYYKRVMASSNVVVLNAEMAAIFPNSAAVNKALHSLVDVAQKPQAYHGAPQDEQKQRTSEP